MDSSQNIEVTEVLYLFGILSCFVGIHLLKNSISVNNYLLPLSPQLNYVRSVTALFFHSETPHIAINMLFLLVAIHLFWDSMHRFTPLLVFFVSGLFGNILVDMIVTGNAVLIGSSTGIMGLLVFLASDPRTSSDIVGTATKLFTIAFFSLEFISYITPIPNSGALVHLSGGFAGLVLFVFYQILRNYL